MGNTTEQVVRFYGSSDFLSFYDKKKRMSLLKKLLRTSEGMALLNVIKYLDAHMGDIPAAGPDSGQVTFIYRGWDSTLNDEDSDPAA